MTTNELIRKIEDAKAKARKNPGQSFFVNASCYYLYNEKADILFCINFNSERKFEKWDLTNEATGEVYNTFRLKMYALNVARNWD